MERLHDRSWKFILLTLMVLGLIELFGYVAAQVLADQHLLHRSPDTRGYADYLAQRDPLLGWPAPSTFGDGGPYDSSGSRIVPAFPDPAEPSCVALFGDSFTWGAEVAPAHAYGNVLAKKLGCRVANYGVGGYGTDQAFLRYAHRIDDPAPDVVLGHYSENIIRNVNQARVLISAVRFGLKPRFVLDDAGSLQLIPLPDLSVEQYANLITHTSELLPHEQFSSDAPWGSPRMRWPYLVAALKTLGSHRVHAKLRGIPSYAPFYAPDHPSGALQVTVEIIRAFVELAESRGQRPTVVLIPDEKDLLGLREGKELPYAPLIDALDALNIATPPVAQSLLTYLGDREPCALYAACGGAHFNPEGYAQLAHIVHDWLTQDRLRAGASVDP